MLRRGVAFIVVLVASFGLTTAATAAPIEPGPDCPEGIACGTVKVPLDWTGKRSGSLGLPVEVADRDAPLLVFLAGGPGQGFAGYGAQIQSLFDQLGLDYRIAVLDQRGTGAVAIRCKRLQSMVLSDLTVRSRSAVRGCGKYLGGKRAFYSTTSTVRDLEAVRKAVGVNRMSIMGTSYGTYVAMRYARTFPGRVDRLVLDSVVPQENVDPFMRIHMKRVAFVLRDVCGNGSCGTKSDPAKDLARLVSMPTRKLKVPGENYRLRVNGPSLLDWMTTILSFDQAAIPFVARAIRKASRGKYADILTVGKNAREFAGKASAESQSWGLHAATLCSDMHTRFATVNDSRFVREIVSRLAVFAPPVRNYWPFDPKTGYWNGVSQACLEWPATRVAKPPRPGTIETPTLFLAGQYDVSTPVGYARRELKRAPKGKLIVVPGAGHSVTFRNQCANTALTLFLQGKLKGDPCRPD